MDDVTVQETTKDDANAVQRVARASWHAAYDDIIGEEAVAETVDSWFARENVIADVNRDERPFFVAESDGAVVGFAIAVPDEDREAAYHLYRIYVHPDHWSEGVGTELLAHLEDGLRERGADRLRLSVFAENETAVGFYESRGFERTDEVRDGKFDLPRYAYVKNLQ